MLDLLQSKFLNLQFCNKPVPRCRKVWPKSKILLSLWHEHKAWTENIVRRIVDSFASSHLHVEVFKGIADIMYTCDGSKRVNVVLHDEQKFEELKL
jgi:hypothetical protein